MSRFGRAVEKAEREGLLTWTRGGEVDRPGAALEEPRVPSPPAPPVVPPAGGHDELWDPASTFEMPRSPLLVATTEPSSPAAEQYRLLRTRLESGRDHTRRSGLLIVSSPGVGDGKTTTSANLALTIAEESQHRVLLVEADLRRPRLADLFGVRPEPGLIDVLVGGATLDDALVAVPGCPLSLLSAGLPGSRPTGLLASTGMQRIVEALRSRFDRIIVDTAPLALADTHVLAQLADSILVIVRAGVTPRPALERTLAGVDRTKLVGIVLNDVDEPPTDYATYATPGPVTRGSAA